MLLRVAIGWHVLYEGLVKIESRRTGLAPFSAEGYLASASGPLRDWFRSQLDDPDGLERLDGAKAAARLDQRLRQAARRLHLSSKQWAAVQQQAAEATKAIKAYLADPETQKKIADYRQKLAELGRRQAMKQVPFGPDRIANQQQELAALRDELLAPVQKQYQAMDQYVSEQATDQQRRQAESISPLAQALGLPFDLRWPEQRIEQINLVTMCGLTLCGGLLLLGLFSRLSALAAAALVLMFYLAHPAPPLGLPSPGDTGHYMYVDMRLIESLALLVLATIPTGRWLGIDALIRGLITRPLAGRLLGRSDSSV